MDKMRVQGGRMLKGEVRAGGAKNSALPILFATLLADGEYVLENVPRLKDIESTCQLLELLGAQTQMEGNTLKVRIHPATEMLAHYDIVRKMRASILCLGPLLARYHKAKVSLPGGCAIGTRPINLHLDALEAMGARLEVKDGYVFGETDGLKGARILFETPSVGATENTMMAAVLAEGRTVIENAAKEPEIVDLANFLNKMGAKITGAGSAVLTIDGPTKLKAVRHRVIPDRIEAGTLLIAGAITGGDVKVLDCDPSGLDALLIKLKEAGFEIETGADWVRLRASGQCLATDVTTAPHPAFPTDLQAQYMALMAVAEGTSLITETIFENRFMHVQELVRMNADITPKTRVAVIRGQPGGLNGAPVMATDLRASACLLLAGLAATGETVVHRIYHLDRGYEGLEKKLSALGADIQRME